MQKEPFEILLESVDSKIQLLLEGFSVLDHKIDTVRNELIERADLTDFKLEALNQKIDAVDKKVDAVDKKVDAVVADLKAHRADTEAHGKGLYVVRET